VEKILRPTVHEDGTVTLADGTDALTTEEQQRIVEVTERAWADYEWDLRNGHNFFLVEQFEETHFQKTSKGGMLGSRYFSLKDLLGPKVTRMTTEEIAKQLKRKSWV